MDNRLPSELLRRVVQGAASAQRRYLLTSQMRVKAGAEYVDYVRRMLRGEVAVDEAVDLGEYEPRLFDDLGQMRREIIARDADAGLARLVAAMRGTG